MSVALILAALTVVIVLYGSRPWEHQQTRQDGPQTADTDEGQVIDPAA